MKQIITSLAFLLYCAAGFAQTMSKQNALSVELGKTGLIYNLTFDHTLPAKQFGFRVAAGSNFARYLKAATVGGGVFYLAGNQRRFFELGMDVQYLSVDEVSDDQKAIALIYPGYSIKTVYPSLNIGYRSYGKSTLFRAGFSPSLIESKLIPGGYIGYGISF